MPRPQGRLAVPTRDEVVAALGDNLAFWRHNCHAAALYLVKSGLLNGQDARVLRGTCPGAGGQHSWVALTSAADVYRPDNIVIDPTLWSYRDNIDGVWIGPAGHMPHLPHGHGSIFAWGRPQPAEGPVIELPAPEGGWTQRAADFLTLLGPLDRRGWRILLGAPMADWPAGEIITQAIRHPELRAAIEIDRLGMLTDLNPGGLYLNGPDRTATAKLEQR